MVQTPESIRKVLGTMSQWSLRSLGHVAGSGKEEAGLRSQNYSIHAKGFRFFTESNTMPQKDFKQWRGIIVFVFRNAYSGCSVN